jgi:hypothetical protein
LSIPQRTDDDATQRAHAELKKAEHRRGIASNPTARHHGRHRHIWKNKAHGRYHRPQRQIDPPETVGITSCHSSRAMWRSVWQMLQKRTSICMSLSVGSRHGIVVEPSGEVALAMA